MAELMLRGTHCFSHMPRNSVTLSSRLACFALGQARPGLPRRGLLRTTLAVGILFAPFVFFPWAARI